MSTHPTLEHEGSAGSDRAAKLRKEISQVEVELAPLSSKLTSLKRELRTENSRAFIELNDIHRAEVEMSSGSDKPDFGTIEQFGEWLSEHSHKEWCEWNGGIYRTRDLFTNQIVMSPTEAYAIDLPD
jgi:hypothetical protein